MSYRSKFEATFHASLPHLGYETTRIPYIVPESAHTYTPDFRVPNTNTWLECKGIFDLADRKKHLLLKAQHPDKTFILVFQNPKATITKGGKTTYTDWCDKHGIPHLTPQQAAKLYADDDAKPR